ncbi:recombinase family protein [Domibacillus aminovorans]|nr:recombinase family protein [Domibacillus aminovorans]
MFQNSSFSEHDHSGSKRTSFYYLFCNKTLFIILCSVTHLLGRNMQDLIQIVNSLNDQGIGFHSLQENLTMDRGNATGQLMFNLFAAFAEFERNLIQERSAAGRVAAKARGRLGGRPEKYGPKDVEMMKSLIESGTPIKDVAERWGVSRTTIYRYLERH